MEQTHNFSSHRIPAGDIRTLVPVAVETRQREIGKVSLTLMLPRDDVIRLKREMIVRRGNPAVLAPAPCPAPNLVEQPWVHDSVPYWDLPPLSDLR